MKALFLLLSMLAVQGAHAQMYKCVDAAGVISFGDKPCKPAAAPGAQAAQGASFAANVLVVKSHAETESWVLMGAAKRGKDSGRMRTVSKGLKVMLPIVATFAQSQLHQRVALVADLEIIAPGGRVQKIPSCCTANRVDPRAPMTIVLNRVIDITFDSTDPVGEYKVRATIHDGKRIAVAEETFVLQGTAR